MLLGKIFPGPDRKARGESLTAWVLNYLFEVEASFTQTRVWLLSSQGEHLHPEVTQSISFTSFLDKLHGHLPAQCTQCCNGGAAVLLSSLFLSSALCWASEGMTGCGVKSPSFSTVSQKIFPPFTPWNHRLKKIIFFLCLHCETYTNLPLPVTVKKCRRNAVGLKWFQNEAWKNRVWKLNTEGLWEFRTLEETSQNMLW